MDNWNLWIGNCFSKFICPSQNHSFNGQKKFDNDWLISLSGSLGNSRSNAIPTRKQTKWIFLPKYIIEINLRIWRITKFCSFFCSSSPSLGWPRKRFSIITYDSYFFLWHDSWTSFKCYHLRQSGLHADFLHLCCCMFNYYSHKCNIITK